MAFRWLLMQPSENLDRRLAWVGLVLNAAGLPALVKLLSSLSLIHI